MASRIKTFRHNLGLTQEQMAEKLNISIKHYSGLERGVAGLSTHNMIKLAEIFGTTTDYLLTGKKSDFETIPVNIKEMYFACPLDKRIHLVKLWEEALKLISCAPEDLYL